MKNLYGIGVLCLLFCLSCQDKNKKQIAALVKEWQGKEILFPEKMVFTRQMKDTVLFPFGDAPYKILVYVDSVGCTSCKLQLPKWKNLMAYTDSLAAGAVSYLFFIHPAHLKEMDYILKRDQFDSPVCIDRSDRLNRLNGFPADIKFQTFLLDRNNKVIGIGNPVHNPNIKELYLQQITGHEKRPAPAKTSVSAVPQVIRWGTFSKSGKKKGIFTLTNTGSSALVILEVSATCGCIRATFDKKAALPGETLRVEVEMTPDFIGPFQEKVLVKCNTKQLLSLQVQGEIR